MFLRSLVKLNNSISVRNFAPKFRRRPTKKGLRRILDLSQSGISYCKVGIICQKTEGARRILPPAPPPNRRLWAPSNLALLKNVWTPLTLNRHVSNYLKDFVELTFE